MSHTKIPGVALFVVNFPAGTGYAWATIERVLVDAAIRLKKAG